MDTSRGLKHFKHTLDLSIKGYINILFITLVVSTVIFTLLFTLINKKYDSYILKIWITSNIYESIDLTKNKTIKFKKPDGSYQKSLAQDIIDNEWFKFQVNKSKSTLIICFIITLILSILSYTLLVKFFVKYGKKVNKGTHIRGGVKASNETVNRLLELKNEKSEYSVGGVHLIKNSETEHVFISGSIGKGKSLAIKELMDTIRSLDHKFILYDKSGEYVKSYYRDGFDIILNPFDQRMPEYCIWNECINLWDYDNIGSSFIPSPSDEGRNETAAHFINSARTLLCDLMKRLKEKDQATSKKLMRFVNQASLESLSDFLNGMDSKSIISPDNERHASDVRATLTPKIKALKYLTGQYNEDGFSLKKWVSDDTDKRCVFIVSGGDLKETLAPLISAWFDIYCRSVLSLNESRDRRIFMILDEIASLPKIESVIDYANEARKFGGCGIYSVTSVEELYRIYGKSRAKTLIGMCGTKITYRCDEPDTAEWISKLYLEEEIHEYTEGVTFSESNKRGDSVNTNKRRSKKPLYMSSEIMQLDKFKSLLKLPGSYPITEVIVKPKDRDVIAESFIKKDMPTTPEEIQPELDQNEEEFRAHPDDIHKLIGDEEKPVPKVPFF